MDKPAEDHARTNAFAWFQNIVGMIDAYRAAEAANDDIHNRSKHAAVDDARERITESILSVEVRSGWETPDVFAGGQDRESYSSVSPAEYLLLLTTGGPALRLTGDLDDNGQPESARLEYQDWGTPWTAVDLRRLAEVLDPRIVVTPRRGDAPIELRMEADDKAKAYLLDFARQFYFGEG